MTAARQRRKPCFALALAVFAAFAAARPAWPAADEQIEVDSHTGLAISGFDPVAYFTERKPRARPAGLRISASTVPSGGSRTRGNRAAFVAHPEVYWPRFGGYDPVAIARGASVPGHPLVWVVVSERLYLFYDEEARAAFLADPGRFIALATRKWPAVARSVDP